MNLKSCPFCAGKAILKEGFPGIYKIYCADCGATQGYADIDFIVKLWNTRINESEREN